MAYMVDPLGQRLGLIRQSAATLPVVSKAYVSQNETGHNSFDRGRSTRFMTFVSAPLDHMMARRIPL